MLLIQKLYLEITGSYEPFKDKNLVAASTQHVTQIPVAQAEYSTTPDWTKKELYDFDDHYMKFNHLILDSYIYVAKHFL